MSLAQSTLNYKAAVRDFDRARKQAALQQLMAKLTGKSVELLSYADVEKKLEARGEIKRGFREIPLDAIVGSVGRFKDFTRSFLPIRESNEERWARVRTAVDEMTGMEPIEVYQVGEVYFVKDGNHRVSVARRLGTSTITALVTEVQTRVPLTLEDDPDELICKSRYVEFLQRTNLDKLRPDADLSMTFCGQYKELFEQIEAHDLLAGRQTGQGDSEGTAATRWYDERYLPVVELFREQGVLRNFPGMTETDLYVLISERTAELQRALGWTIGTGIAIGELTEQEKQRARPVIQRVSERLLDALVPDEFEEGPAPGQWRTKRTTFGRKDRLFADYLVAMSGSSDDWLMLDEVIRMAKMEGDRLLGLHVVSKKSKIDGGKARAVRERFERRCREEGVSGELAVEAGKVTDVIVKRAAWADLVIVSLAHRPTSQPLERLGHGFSRLVQRCPRPILAIPAGSKLRMNRLLLAYDGSPKSDEALFVATYLRSRWPISLTVLTVESEHTTRADLDRARRYVEQFGVDDVDYVLRNKPIAEAILATAEEHGSNTLIMGGFGFRPLLHLVLGSTVDQILREFGRPILLCR
jgi:nucleotide-binding universal stress UspA family protein